MHIFTVKSPVTLKDTHLQNIEVTENNQFFSLHFTEGKRKGNFNWGPSSIPFLVRNQVEFIRYGDYFLLFSSALNNRKQLDVLLSALLEEKVKTILVRPLVTKKDIEKQTFFRAITVVSHEKDWYISSMLKDEEKLFTFEYSTINGRVQTSMLVGDEWKEKIGALTFHLLTKKEQLI